MTVGIEGLLREKTRSPGTHRPRLSWFRPCCLHRDIFDSPTHLEETIPRCPHAYNQAEACAFRWQADRAANVAAHTQCYPKLQCLAEDSFVLD